jgi:hypothetical protein
MANFILSCSYIYESSILSNLITMVLVHNLMNLLKYLNLFHVWSTIMIIMYPVNYPYLVGGPTVLGKMTRVSLTIVTFAQIS